MAFVEGQLYLWNKSWPAGNDMEHSCREAHSLPGNAQGSRSRLDGQREQQPHSHANGGQWGSTLMPVAKKKKKRKSSDPWVCSAIRWPILALQIALQIWDELRYHNLVCIHSVCVLGSGVSCCPLFGYVHNSSFSILANIIWCVASLQSYSCPEMQKWLAWMVSLACHVEDEFLRWGSRKMGSPKLHRKLMMLGLTKTTRSSLWNGGWGKCTLCPPVVIGSSRHLS